MKVMTSVNRLNLTTLVASSELKKPCIHKFRSTSGKPFIGQGPASPHHYLVSKLQRIPGLSAEVLNPGLDSFRRALGGLLDVLQSLVQKNVAAGIRTLDLDFPQQQILATHASVLLNREEKTLIFLFYSLKRWLMG